MSEYVPMSDKCLDLCPLCKNVWICVHGKNVQMFVAQNWNVCMLFTDYLVVDPRSGSIRRVSVITEMRFKALF